jgi:hypothetical protein
MSLTTCIFHGMSISGSHGKYICNPNYDSIEKRHHLCHAPYLDPDYDGDNWNGTKLFVFE